MNRPRPYSGHGFALIEVLVACALLATGLLLLIVTQPLMFRSADLARQRSEALRLAHAQLERLRGTTNAANDADSDGGDDTATDQTTYARRWRIQADGDQRWRQLSVAVDWTDRAEQAHTVALRTLLAPVDPRWSGAVAHAPRPGTSWRRAHDRQAQIPLPALRLDAQHSAVPMGSDMAVIVDNGSGEVVMVCAAPVLSPEQVAGACQAATGLLLSGHLARSASTLPWPSGVDLSGLSGLATAPASVCRLSDAVDASTGQALPEQKRYVCLLAASGAGGGWSGRIRLLGVPTDADHVVCRVQLTDADLDPNQRNAQDYRAVKTHLLHQNYRLHRSSTGTCPEPDVSDHLLVLHQDCRSNDPDRAASQCPASALRSAP